MVCTPNPVSAAKTDIFTLEWKDAVNSDGTDCKRIPAHAELFQNAQSPDLAHLVTNAVFITTQENKANCKHKRSLVGKFASAYSYDRTDLFVWLSKVDRAVQNSIPSALFALIMYLSRYPVVVCHRRKRRPQDTLRKEFYQMTQKYLACVLRHKKPKNA